MAEWTEWKIPPPTHIDDEGFLIEGWPEIQLTAHAIHKMDDGRIVCAVVCQRKEELEINKGPARRKYIKSLKEIAEQGLLEAASRLGEEDDDGGE